MIIIVYSGAIRSTEVLLDVRNVAVFEYVAGADELVTNNVEGVVFAEIISHVVAVHGVNNVEVSE